MEYLWNMMVFNGHDEKEPIEWRYLPYTRTIYFSGQCKGTFAWDMALHGTVPPFEDPGISIDFLVLEFRSCESWLMNWLYDWWTIGEHHRHSLMISGAMPLLACNIPTFQGFHIYWHCNIVHQYRRAIVHTSFERMSVILDIMTYLNSATFLQCGPFPVNNWVVYQTTDIL